MIRLFVTVPGWHCQAKRYKLAINNFLSFRPLLDVINTPSYKLVKGISRNKYSSFFLSPLFTNEFTVRNALAFATEISKTDSNYTMAGLDLERFLI